MTPETLVAVLVRASLEGALFVLLVGAVATLAGRIPAAARCALWWIASLRLLLGLAALPGLVVPVTLPFAAPSAVTVSAARIAAPILGAFASPAPTTAATTNSPSPARPARPSPAGFAAIGALAIWLAGLVGVLLVHLRDARRLARLWNHARRVRSPRVDGWLVEWLGDAAARRVELRVSDAVEAPLIMTGTHPRIVVPSRCLEDDDARLRMAIAHEVGHVRRRDLAWGLVPALAQGVFWFHPLVHWCVREYTQSREEACDAEALRLSAAAPHRYGELLVGFGVDGSRAAHAAVSCGSSHVHQLHRRLRMLGHASRSSRLQRGLAAASMVALGALAIVPVRFVPATAAVLDTDPPSQTHTSTVEHTKTKVSTKVITSTGAAATSRGAGSSSSNSVASKSKSSGGRSYGYSYRDDDFDDFSYGFNHGDSHTMSGSWRDDDEGWFERLKERGEGEFAWFRIDGKTYLVQGKADVERIQEMMKPELELGQQQGKLGAEQGRLGGKQGELGDRQSALGEMQSQLSERLSEVSEQMAYTRDSERRDDLERMRDELQGKMQELSQRQSELGRRQSELGGLQSGLGQRQSALGRRQAELSRQTREKMRKLGPEMIRDGRAVLIDG